MKEINKSCTYILPLFCNYFLNKNELLEEVLFTSFLNNCFCLKEENDKQYKEFVIQFNNLKDNNIFNNFLLNLEKSDIFVNKIIDGEYITVFFLIPKEIEESYNYFLEGKFSKILEKDKIKILNFSKKYTSNEMSLELQQIFSKSKKRRKELEDRLGITIPEDLELVSKPDLVKEKFNIKIINV